MLKNGTGKSGTPPDLGAGNPDISEFSIPDASGNIVWE
jgi:hypothetical protein